MLYSLVFDKCKQILLTITIIFTSCLRLFSNAVLTFVGCFLLDATLVGSTEYSKIVGTASFLRRSRPAVHPTDCIASKFCTKHELSKCCEHNFELFVGFQFLRRIFSIQISRMRLFSGNEKKETFCCVSWFLEEPFLQLNAAQ